VRPRIPAVDPDRADIDVRQYSSIAALCLIASSFSGNGSETHVQCILQIKQLGKGCVHASLRSYHSGNFRPLPPVKPCCRLHILTLMVTLSLNLTLTKVIK